MRRSPSKASLADSGSTPTLATSSSSTLNIDIKAEPSKGLPDLPDTFAPMPLVQAANAALMERTPFAIDDAKDDEDDGDDFFDDDEEDDQVMDEVCTGSFTTILLLTADIGGCLP